jgi:Ca2+-binding RTX toxin-like protein
MDFFNKIIPDGFFDFLPGVGNDDQEETEAARDIATTAARFITLGPTGFVLSSVFSRLIGNVDVNQVGSQFLNRVNELIESNQTAVNSTQFLNSVVGEIRNFVDSNEIAQRFSLTEIADFVNTNLIENPTVQEGFSELINRAAQGSQLGRFVDADSASNLIEIALEDINWPGGLRGLEGDDRIIGSSGSDVANGNQGNDTIFGGEGDDFLRGGKDNDLLDGGIGNDVLNGNLGDDTIRGGTGDDLIRGGQGNDVLYGDEGRDILIGDMGSDFLYGGADADDFILRADVAGTDAATADRILDFNAAQGDRIKLVNVDDISNIILGAVDINTDGIGDTAIIDSNNRVLGVVMNVDVSEFNLLDYIQVVSAEDLGIDLLG